MRIGIKNNNNFVHTVCRTTGQQMVINPKSFIVIDTDNEQEINYWTKLRKEVTDRIGITVVLDERDISKLTNETRYYTDVSVVDGAVSPVAKQIADSIMNDIPKEEPKQLQESISYTEEQLSNMTKEELFKICTDRNIKYKKNNSVKTLVNLILGSDVS